MRICAAMLIIAGIYFAVSGVFNLSYAQDIQTSLLYSDFTLSDLDGNQITLSELRQNKSVVLFFWTTWCPFCIRELLKLNQGYPESILEDIEILAINVGESGTKVRQFLKKHNIDFKVLLDIDSRVADSYGLIGVPTFVLINKQGDIVFKDHFFPEQTYKGLL